MRHTGTVWAAYLERMTDNEITILADGFSYLECPRWHDGRVWLSDFYTHSVVAVSLDGGVEELATVPGQPSGLAWLPDGRMLVVSMKDQQVLRREPDGSLVVHADLSAHARGLCNDMVVGAGGNAYVGEFGFDLMGGAAFASAPILRIDPEGNVTVAAEGLKFPNGSVITPDGRRLIVDETFGNRISAFDIAADGSLGQRRDWATFGDVPAEGAPLPELLAGTRVAPDGNTLDAEGCLWVADAVGNRVIRVREGEGIVDEISTGDLGVYAVGLGGEDGRTLFLCLAPDFEEHKRAPVREAKLGCVRVDAPHAGLP